MVRQSVLRSPSRKHATSFVFSARSVGRILYKELKFLPNRLDKMQELDLRNFLLLKTIHFKRFSQWHSSKYNQHTCLNAGTSWIGMGRKMYSWLRLNKPRRLYAFQCRRDRNMLARIVVNNEWIDTLRRRRRCTAPPYTML